jgi:hypothetical protein
LHTKLQWGIRFEFESAASDRQFSVNKKNDGGRCPHRVLLNLYLAAAPFSATVFIARFRAVFFAGAILFDAPAFLATPFFAGAFFAIFLAIAPLDANDFAFAFLRAAPGWLAAAFATAAPLAIRNFERSLT